ncbi:MAG: hemolysin family protein [Chloroflexales bacterium]|nr:hemolysin family protein [Chloroflexales bacterium]
MLELFTAVLIVLGSSALCSGSEAALFSVSLVRVRQLAQSNSSAAQTLLKIRENMSRPIATIVILNNIANIVGSIAVGAIAATALGDQWLAVFSGMLTFLVIIFSEIIPKTLGERYSERIALIVARPVATLAWLFTPLVWAIERLTSPITKGKRLPTTNEAEIKLLAKIGQQEGIIESDESEMIQRVFRLNDATAGSLMTPRVNITYLHGDATLAEAKDDILGSQHTRIIVINESIDNVLGIALKEELLAAMIAGKFDQPVANVTRGARVVPESVRADKLLEVFRQTRQHLAVVIDEFGGVAGVVTLEDVLEVLTGEIVDETDRVVDLQEEARQRSRKFFGQP